MRTRNELLRNSKTILQRTNELLKSNRRKTSKIIQKVKEGTEKPPTTEEMENISWVLKNKILPMVTQMTDLQKSIDNLQQYPIGKYPINKKRVKEGNEVRVTHFDSNPKFESWKEKPSGKRYDPLLFIRWTWDVLGRDNARESLLLRYQQKYVHDFVWLKEDVQKNQTYIYVLVNDEKMVSSVLRNSKTPSKGKRKSLKEREIPVYRLDQRTDEKLPTKDSSGKSLKRLDTFSEKPDDTTSKDEYPFGRYRGISTHYYRYIWNHLGTEKGQEELVRRYLKGLPEKQPYGNHTDVSLKEYPEENRTIVYKTIYKDSSD